MVRPALARQKVDIENLQRQLEQMTTARTRALDARQRTLELDRQLLALQKTQRERYFEALRLERQNKQNTLKALEGLSTSVQETTRPRTPNDEYAANTLLLSTRSSITERVQQNEARLKEIEVALQSSVAPNDGEIKAIEHRIREAETAIAVGDSGFEQNILRLQSDISRLKADMDVQSALLPRVVAAPYAANRHISPRLSLVMPIAFFLGLLLGVLWALGPSIARHFLRGPNALAQL
jgi:hypothetical protein